ncbi:MAG: group II intron reverse transcriptase/maturase [Pirellulaceae bacterium]|nr:group II intron reverse transcriptase/maturase [Pirellulaceae bacterium]MBX3416195.1 group II intron reverse transcriptase/maturase [Pirellulaceae bacterium]MBX3416963.1 group II intron reverse transcriptase/maturase [Pirellulaceae bacterium]MBX3417211.1 group II intron reverse transcriptase/maturase [Pirellulaceae bacterium]MBX3417386.1 group II intron reverse transcriptase/maturase [Pirellulaceae bacterium]
MTKQSKDLKPSQVTVPFGATPATEPLSIDQWASSMVWTESMLKTLLANKVRGGKWHTLYDKVFSERNLRWAASKVITNQGAAGVDRQTVEQLDDELLAEITKLQQELKAGTYRPQPVRRVEIPKPGTKETRPLGIPTVRDRVVQTALLDVLEPIFDHTFHPRSFGFRRGRGCHGALRCVEQLLEEGNVFVVDADLKGYFDTIPKDRLLALVKQKVSDHAVLRLIKMYLDQEVVSELSRWTPETGVPQGAVLSPMLSNLYLNPLDHHMAEQGYEMVRYADDFVILCKTQAEAEQALAVVQQWVREAGLTLHPDKTQIVDSRDQSFAFLGYVFRGRFRFPRAKSQQKFMDRVRELTPRTSGDSLEDIVKQLNQMMRGWFHYFRHCFWNVYGDYDSWLRSRLRRILLKRHRTNPDRQPRTCRWPNRYFSELGLYSLVQAHAQFVQTIENYQVESRMRENRTYGSAGGGVS